MTSEAFTASAWKRVLVAMDRIAAVPEWHLRRGQGAAPAAPRQPLAPPPTMRKPARLTLWSEAVFFLTFFQRPALPHWLTAEGAVVQLALQPPPLGNRLMEWPCFA